MSNFTNLLLSVGVDSSQANKDLEALSKKASSEGDKATEKQKSGYSRVREAVQQVEDAVARVGGKWEAIRETMAAAGVALYGLKGSAEKLYEFAGQAARIADTRQGYLLAGGNEEIIKKVNAALGGTVDQMTTLKSMREAALATIDSKEMEEMAKGAAYMAAQLGRSKADMLEMVASGKVDETTWDKLGVSLRAVEQLIMQAQARAGRSLTDTEKQALSIRYFIETTRKASDGFSSSTKQASDSFARVSVSIENIKKDLGEAILPTVIKIVGWAEKWAARMNTVSKTVSLMFGGKKDQFAGMGAAMGKEFSSQMTEAEKKVAEVKKKAEEAQKSNADIIKKSLYAKPGGFSQETMERTQEIIGRQSAARAMIRNFETESLMAVQKMGGPVSRVLGALSQYSEKLRVIGSLWPGLAAQAAGKTKEELDALRESGKLSDSKYKAALLLNQYREAGLGGMKKILYAEEAINEQMEASISPSSALATLSGVRIQRIQMEKQIGESRFALDKAQELLAVTRDKNQREVLARVIKEAQVLPKIVSERMRLLKIREEMAKIEFASEQRQATLALRGTALATEERLLTTRLKLAELRGDDPRGIEMQQRMVALDKIQLEIATKQSELAKEEALLRTGRYIGKSLEMQQAKVAGIAAEIEGLGKVLKLEQAIFAEMQRPEIASILAKQTKAFLDTTIGQISQYTTDFFTAIFQAKSIDQALGKILLSIFGSIGDALMAAGVQTLMMGLASLTNPYLGANPGAIPLGAAMILAGGAIKAGSIVAAQQTAESAASGGTQAASKSTTPEPTGPAESAMNGAGQTIIIQNFSDPYLEGQHEARAAGLLRYVGKYGIRSGVRLPRSLVSG